MSDPVELLDFWITEIGPKGWFNGGDAVDSACRDRFLDLWQAAHDGGLEHWVDGPTGTLAYLILTDQFPRNMFRGEARAFATDARARAAARRAVALGWDATPPWGARQRPKSRPSSTQGPILRWSASCGKSRRKAMRQMHRPTATPMLLGFCR
jgi:uncharacterized protein (DUF924 family)